MKNSIIMNLDPEWANTFGAGLHAARLNPSNNQNIGKNLFSVDLLSIKNGEIEDDLEQQITLKAGKKAFKSEDFSYKNDSKTPKNLAVLNIRGVLDYSYSEWLEFFGGSSYEQITKAFKSLVADPSIATIILRVQSPGGNAMGSSELSELIYNARDKKRIIGFADPYAFSAGYQIITAASEVYSIPSGMVGSVGSYVQHADYSQMLEKDGVKVTFIFAGEKKVAGNSYEPLSESAKADLQAEVDEFYSMFVADLARNRGESEESVKANFGKGSRVMTKKGLSVNMLDGIINFDELLKSEVQALTNESSKIRNSAFFENSKRFIELENLK